jgi:hypothetical protein
MQSACDSIAINLAATAVLGGLLLGIAGRWFADDRRSVRCINIMAALGLTVIAFVLIEPRCLGGPLAMVDSTVRPIWLAHVSEVQSLIGVIGNKNNPVSGIAIAAYPVAAAIAAIVLAQDATVRRDSAFLTAATAMAVASVILLRYHHFGRGDQPVPIIELRSKRQSVLRNRKLRGACAPSHRCCCRRYRLWAISTGVSATFGARSAVSPIVVWDH